MLIANIKFFLKTCCISKKLYYTKNPLMILFNLCRFFMRYWSIFYKNNFASKASSDPNFKKESTSV